VRIEPQAFLPFPSGNSENRYYAARQTSSASLLIETPSGSQREKFLFYRGISALLPPPTATISPDGTLLLQNHFAEPIPIVIFFERRGEEAGYRVFGSLGSQGTLASPDLSEFTDSLSSNLEGILISQGLFPDEAHAMLQTWQNSWFEEGSRLIYIVPRTFVDSVLPLHVRPAPANIVRVFVGRLELITPSTENAVESALASHDETTLSKYSRFLEPILQSMILQSSDTSRRRLLARYLNSAYTRVYAQTQK
jgi:hypothetical protein